MEIAGGKILHVEDAALPRGTTISVADLFFNTPARRKFLRAESTELSHVTALVTHYALAHPEKHFELLSASHTIVSAPPVRRTAERIYQIFGKETLAQLLPVAAEMPLDRAGLPEPPPWKRDPDEPRRDPGTCASPASIPSPNCKSSIATPSTSSSTSDSSAIACCSTPSPRPIATSFRPPALPWFCSSSKCRRKKWT